MGSGSGKHSGKEGKRSKHKHKHKHSKHKHGSSKKDHEASASDSGGEWVESAPASATAGAGASRAAALADPRPDAATSGGGAAREDWMMAPPARALGTLDPSSKARKDEKEAEKGQAKWQTPEAMRGTSSRELNPYWKDGGTGAPAEDGATRRSAVSRRVGDGGASWRARAAQRRRQRTNEGSADDAGSKADDRQSSRDGMGAHTGSDSVAVASARGDVTEQRRHHRVREHSYVGEALRQMRAPTGDVRWGSGHTRPVSTDHNLVDSRDSRSHHHGEDDRDARRPSPPPGTSERSEPQRAPGPAAPPASGGASRPNGSGERDGDRITSSPRQHRPPAEFAHAVSHSRADMRREPSPRPGAGSGAAAAPAAPVMSSAELNKLASKVVKAQIMGDTEKHARLSAQLAAARAAAEKAKPPTPQPGAEGRELNAGRSGPHAHGGEGRRRDRPERRDSGSDADGDGSAVDVHVLQDFDIHGKAQPWLAARGRDGGGGGGGGGGGYGRRWRSGSNSDSGDSSASGSGRRGHGLDRNGKIRKRGHRRLDEYGDESGGDMSDGLEEDGKWHGADAEAAALEAAALTKANVWTLDRDPMAAMGTEEQVAAAQRSQAEAAAAKAKTDFSARARQQARPNMHGADGERERHYANDEDFSLQDLVRAERAGKGSAQEYNRNLINNVMRREHWVANRMPGGQADQEMFGDDMDANIFEANAGQKKRKRGGRERPTEMQKDMQRAVRDQQRMDRMTDRCLWCPDSDGHRDDLVVAVGSNVYLSLPSRVRLAPGHVVIAPREHVRSSIDADDDVWDEMRNFMKCLHRMVASASPPMDILFFESVRNVKHHRHCAIEAIPVPAAAGADAPLYFRKALSEADEEWSQHRKLIDVQKRGGLRRSVPKGFPYFWVGFGATGPGFAHVIEDNDQFSPHFGFEIIGGILEVEPHVWTKPPRRKPRSRDERQAVAAFKKSFEPFDWTKVFDGKELGPSEGAGDDGGGGASGAAAAEPEPKPDAFSDWIVGAATTKK